MALKIGSFAGDTSLEMYQNNLQIGIIGILDLCVAIRGSRQQSDFIGEMSHLKITQLLGTKFPPTNPKPCVDAVYDTEPHYIIGINNESPPA